MASPTVVNQHYGHDSSHPFTEIDAPQVFLCGGCKTTGNGKRLHCVLCDFNLHPVCANSPLELSTFMHPAHPIPLFNCPAAGSKFVCNVCGDDIIGALYYCKPCKFSFHPCCSEIPQYVKNESLDPLYPLVLQPPVQIRACNLCKGGCDLRYWWYRSVSNDADAHFWCLNGTKEPHQPTTQPHKHRSEVFLEVLVTSASEAAMQLFS